jgi:hypothetical protein
MFEIRVLRRIFGPKREEVVGCWRMHNEELRNFYASPNVIWVMKSRRMRWVGHVSCMGGMKHVNRRDLPFMCSFHALVQGMHN